MRRTRTPQQGPTQEASWLSYTLIFGAFFFLGYYISFLSKDAMSFRKDVVVLETQETPAVVAAAAPPQQQDPFKRHAGRTVHCLHTSNGGHYMNYQSRIMYASFKMVAKEPGGEVMTGFTRIMHRSVPDYLMDEIPTFHATPKRVACDGWCDYPVADRPDAIKQWFDAAARDPSMIQGAWIFMLESDYVFMRPMKLPGDAWDPSVPGVQFHFDYIIPSHPNAIPSMRKLYQGPVTDIPNSGPAPALMRFHQWRQVLPDYVRLSAEMEKDEAIKRDLGWVREMYAWDAAEARHRANVTMRTEHPPLSTTIVQPPFDNGLGEACLCHYTWGPQYHTAPPSKGGKLIFGFEKREISTLDKVLKIQKLETPPEFREGIFLEFDAPLTRPRHDLVVLMINQINKVIETLPDLTEYYHNVAWPAIAEATTQRNMAMTPV